jgi:hypothetical protein
MTEAICMALGIALGSGAAAFLAVRILSRRAALFVPWKPEYNKTDLELWNERTKEGA